MENCSHEIRKDISVWFHVINDAHQGLLRGNQLLEKALIYGPKYEPGIYEWMIGLRIDVDGMKVAMDLDPVLDFPLLEPCRSLGGSRGNNSDVCLGLLG